MAEKSIEEQYMELIGQIDPDDLQTPSFMSSYSSDTDKEDFSTTFEIHQKEEELRLDGKIIPRKPVVIDEDVHFQTFAKPREHKYTEKELAKIRESCESTIVHDFSEYDMYHASDEERTRSNMLSSLAVKLGSMRSIYHKVDQYIEAMRVVREAWEILAQHNYVHTREEFFKLVAEGHIVSSQIIMPKLKKMNQYNLDMLIRYISNPELDPKDLVPVTPVLDDDDDDLDNESAEEELEKMMRLLSPEEIQYVHDNEDDPPEIKVEIIKRKYVVGYDRRNFLSAKKKRSKLKKTDRYIADGVHDLLNKIQSNPNNQERGYATYTVTHSMFDTKPEESHDPLDSIKFRGSWANKYDVALYNMVMHEVMMSQHTLNEPSLTYGDINLRNFFRSLEDAGFNVVDYRRRMNCTTEQEDNRTAKQKQKMNKKIEGEILQRITKLNNNPKFKKLIHKAEKDLNKYQEEN